MSETPCRTRARKYPIHQSPFFKLRGWGQLEALLQINLDHLDRLLSLDNYRVWTNERGREIQQPIRWLGQVHARIAGLLSRIEVPDYVFSQKGRSHLGNARRHMGWVPLVKTDVSGFYPSTTREMVRRMFAAQFQCASDISRVLADICCYEQKHLPTGSPLSGYVAFFAAKPMFDDIYRRAQSAGSRMTVFVDDVTISGQALNKRFLSEVRADVRRHGLRTKRSKSKTFPAHAAKMVTGAAIIGPEIRLPNVRHKRIAETRRAIQNATPEEREKLLRSLKGRLQEAKQLLDSKDEG